MNKQKKMHVLKTKDEKQGSCSIKCARGVLLKTKDEKQANFFSLTAQDKQLCSKGIVVRQHVSTLGGF
jgi:hypothetical protein